MPEAKLSSKNQIVIPREAREAMKLTAGDRLLVVVRGETLLLMRKPDRYADALTRVGPDLYPRDYLERERESWR